ncbi:MAG: hypothetical protein ACXW61_03755 [Gemmatirosa sp.]
MRGRRGAALPIALVLLVVGSALAVGSAAVMRDAVRSSRAPAAALQARAAADAAIASAMRHWRSDWVMTLAPGAARREELSTAAGSASLTVLRLDVHRFLLVSESRARTGVPGAGAEAVRRVGAFVRLQRVWIEPPAALVAGGPVVAAAGAVIRGADVAPAGWDCPQPPAPAADLAIAHPDDSVDVAPGVLATPAVLETPAARDDATYERFGDDAWDALARRAHVVLAAGGVHSPAPREQGGACVVDAGSWGDPRRGAGASSSCAASAPVVHVRGAGVTRLVGPARMQGMLLVDGDLAVEGDVEIAGVVLVRGALRAPTAALRVTGALLVRQRAFAMGAPHAVELGPASVVQRSSCVVTTVTLAASRVMRVGRRGGATVTR